MKASEVIAIYDDLYPNTRSMDVKLRWLKTIEQLIMNEVILTHEILETDMCGTEDFDSDTYFDGWDESREMLCVEPYTDTYITYLEAQEARTNQETDHYNVAALMHNNAYKAYQNYWNRTHLPNPTPTAWIEHRML